MNKKLLGISVVLISLVIFTCLFLRWSSFMAPDQNLFVVGTASGYAPFVSINEQGIYEGFDIDIAQEIAKRLGKKLVLKDLGSMVTLLLALKQNKIDCVIWALSITQERLQEFAMIHYQGQEIKKLPLVFWNKIPAGIASIQDLKKYPSAVICVEPGSSNEAFLQKFDFVTLKPMDKIVDAILDIKYGKSLATVIDPSLMNDVTAKYPELKVLEIPLDEQWRIFGNGIACNKDNTTIIEQIRQGVEQIKADGTVAQLERTWNLKG